MLISLNPALQISNSVFPIFRSYSEEGIPPGSDAKSCIRAFSSVGFWAAFSSIQSNKKIVDMNTYQNGPEKRRQTENKRVHRRITVFEPRAYADCKSIAQALFRKEIVIITFSAMEEYQARRVVDFVTGTIYAVDGDIQRIGEEIFICTPANVDIDSSVAQSLISAHLSNY